MTALRTLLERLPADAMLPVGWLIEQLDHTPANPPADAPDLDVAALAKLMRRSPATVRGWLERGLVVGAYKLPGSSPRRCAWRIPAASVALFRQQQARPLQLTTAAEPAAHISDWRHVRRRGTR